MEKDQSFSHMVWDSTVIRPIHDEITPPRTDRGPHVVRYLHVGEIPGKYSIGIFVFPPHACIPLHDHPGMCVLSRVLYGDLHRTSMDLVPNSTSRSSWRSLLFPLSSPSKKCYQVTNVRDDHLQAPDITMLFPREGNVHEFVAGPHGAAVLDVLVPPYCGTDQRDCTFYITKEEQGGLSWIYPTEQPEDFHCLSGSYRDFGET
jgi:PCO_ADO